ncbi:MAG TPA: bifunctional response regulator/alkaline phosphatase family protein [Bacteroidales bacterium]|nr:bifunctional response regulator/alkaline phosphatase family protein [Bacteroidales bacterium]
MPVSILWVDDEIDHLKPHIIFLKQKGYEVSTSSNGSDALDLITDNVFDIVFLDENMPGISGLETLSMIKKLQPGLPVVMITKSEEEAIMNEAIGSSINDYLIKPVNPHQILLSLKKNLENKKLIGEWASSGYQRIFRHIGMALDGKPDLHHWMDLFRQLVFWELELEKSDDNSLKEVCRMQKAEANNVFSRYVEKNYVGWLKGTSHERPILSHTVFREKCLPFIKAEEKIFLILIDNLRFDQWKAIQPFFEKYYRIVSEDIYCSILPTSTQFARNSFFAGLLPGEIEKRHPAFWVNEGEDENGTRNQYESELLGEQLKRLGSDIKYNYHKILNLTSGKKLAETLNNFSNTKLNVLVYNFVDMLSHARTEMEIIKELAENEAAYRSLTMSWFEHSPLFEIIKALSDKNTSIILTTDHGSIRVHNPSKVIGDKNTNTNLRYKTGRNLNYKQQEVFEIKSPADAYLPKGNISSNYIFALNDSFFAYPNNYNYYVNFYRNTFQHGGVSLDEMFIPLVFMKAR